MAHMTSPYGDKQLASLSGQIRELYDRALNIWENDWNSWWYPESLIVLKATLEALKAVYIHRQYSFDLVLLRDAANHLVTRVWLEAHKADVKAWEDLIKIPEEIRNLPVPIMKPGETAWAEVRVDSNGTLIPIVGFWTVDAYTVLRPSEDMKEYLAILKKRNTPLLLSSVSVQVEARGVYLLEWLDLAPGNWFRIIGRVR